MKFRKDNRIKYGQDCAQWKGVPAGVDFEVRRFPSGGAKHMYILTAPWYGDLSRPGQYGNGALYVWGLTKRQRAQFDKHVTKEPKP